MNMLRERLKSMEISITELADYMQVSRPTMYKFIEYYDDLKFDLINKRILKLFNYISEHELAGKKNVVNYILSYLVELKNDDNEQDITDAVRKYILSNPESKKSHFLISCASQHSFDSIIPYLLKIEPLLRKRKLTEDEKFVLQPYIEFKDKIQ